MPSYAVTYFTGNWKRYSTSFPGEREWMMEPTKKQTTTLFWFRMIATSCQTSCNSIWGRLLDAGLPRYKPLVKTYRNLQVSIAVTLVTANRASTQAWLLRELLGTSPSSSFPVFHLYKIKLIIKEIIIAKSQNCVLTQTFRVYNPFSSVWKITVKIRNISVTTLKGSAYA